MPHILHITASIRGDESVSSALGHSLIKNLSGQSGDAVTVRDLARHDLPFVSADRFAANSTPAADRTAAQADLAAIADELIAELQAADTIIISSPVYNFGVPASLKAWADLVARAGTTFEYTQAGPAGLLKGKKAFITVTSGGMPIGSDMDFMTRWLTFFLGFLGIDDVEIIAADGIAGADADAKIAAAHEQAQRLAA